MDLQALNKGCEMAPGEEFELKAQTRAGGWDLNRGGELSSPREPRGVLSSFEKLFVKSISLILNEFSSLFLSES